MDVPGRTLHTNTQSRLLRGFVRKDRHDELRVGDGWNFCKGQGYWFRLRFEVTTHSPIGSLGSHEGLHANDLRKGLLFLCFREPKLFGIYSALQ